jgi:hypothetical protein
VSAEQVIGHVVEADIAGAADELPAGKGVALQRPFVAGGLHVGRDA